MTILRESNSDDSRVRNEGKQAIDSHFVSLKKDSTQKAEATSSPPFSVTKVEDIIKSTIWLFRSSVNMHKVWSPPMHVSEAGVVSEPLVVGMHADTGIQQLGIESNIAQENSPKTEQQELLQRKQKLAPFWGIICPAVKVHCEVKRLELEVKLARFLRDTCNN